MVDGELLTSSVPRALEMKTKLFGFELPDLLFIFMNLAITNLIFGATKFRYPMVWGTTLGIALFLYLFKKGRPDNYLQHFCEMHSRALHFEAGANDLKYRRFKKG